MYKTVEELEAKIAEYFENVPTKIRSLNGVSTEVPVPTITGLSLFLGFCDRRSMLDYEARGKFSRTIKKARALIEQHYEELLQTGNNTGAIFALKNFGWSDKLEIEGNVNHTEGIIRVPAKKPVGAAVTEIAQA